MKIDSGIQKNISDINNLKIDLFLFANNNENRKYCLLKKLKEHNTLVNCISLYYKEEFEDIEGIQNLYIKNHLEIEKLLFEKLTENNQEEFVLVVDYSCMTKSWYYTILLFLANKELDFKKVTCIFSYTPSTFSPPLPPKPNSNISPLPGKFVIPNNRPKALIVGLGYEENKAQGIIDQIDPAKVFLMYSKPTLDDRFTNTIEKNNENILNEFRSSTLIYNFSDLIDIENKLKSIYYKFNRDYNIIISPLGPKPFTFVSMMMSIIFDDVEIWRIGSGEDINPYPREPFEDNKFIISEITFYSKN